MVHPALVLAARSGDLDDVRGLVEGGRDVNEAEGGKSIGFGFTALISAARKGHSGIVRFLLEAGADVNLANHAGSTPLIWSSICGHHAVVKMLLDWGAKVDQANSGGSTPLIYASSNGHYVVTKLLLTAGADVNHANNYGRTALSVADHYGHALIIHHSVTVPCRLAAYACVRRAIAIEEGREFQDLGSLVPRIVAKLSPLLRRVLLTNFFGRGALLAEEPVTELLQRLARAPDDIVRVIVLFVGEGGGVEE